VRAREVHVLVVDDEPLAVETLSVFLTRRGCTVTEAEDGIEALAHCRERRFDIVFTDMRMPGMDGGQLIQAIGAEHPDLPVVIVTGQSEAVDSDTFPRPAVRAVLRKPLNLREVEGLIHALPGRER
jgi:CheY-like chemotaxis protein